MERQFLCVQRFVARGWAHGGEGAQSTTHPEPTFDVYVLGGRLDM